MNPTPRRIIVGVTFPHDDGAVVEVAAAFAGALGAELVLAGIVPPALPEPARDAPGEISTLARQTEQQRLLDGLVDEPLQELAGELSGAVRVRTLVAWGPLGPALVAAAREQDADLVVIPMRRESELRHVLHDHADRHVLHHCDVPVLVVPSPWPACLRSSPRRRRSRRVVLGAERKIVLSPADRRRTAYHAAGLEPPTRPAPLPVAA